VSINVPVLGGSRRRSRSARALLALTVPALTPALALPAEPHRARASAGHFICGGPNAAHVPCRFSTPSANIRCLWTPVPNRVECVRLATGRAFRLGPTGHAKAIRLSLPHRGQTLAPNQQLEFPGSFSCHDSYLTMTCNQNFLSGSFRLAPHGSRST
jgi:hypothetical protein